MSRWFLVSALACLLPMVRGLPVRADETPPKPSFAKDVQPVLTKYCLGCHGPEKQRANIRFDRYKADADALKNPKLW